MSRIFIKLLGLNGGNNKTVVPPATYELFIPAGNDSFVTSDAQILYVKEA